MSASRVHLPLAGFEHARRLGPLELDRAVGRAGYARLVVVVRAAVGEYRAVAEEDERGAKQRIGCVALLVEDGLQRSWRVRDQVGWPVAKAARSVVGPRCRPARRSRQAQDSALIAAG